MTKIILYFFSYALSQDYLHEINREIREIYANDILNNIDRQNVNSFISERIGQLAHSEWINGSDIQSIQDKCLYKFDRMISHRKEFSYMFEPSLKSLNIREIEYSASSNENACPPQICTAEVIDEVYRFDFNVTSVECLPKKVETYDIPKESVSKHSSKSVIQKINLSGKDFLIILYFLLAVMVCMIASKYGSSTNRDDDGDYGYYDDGDDGGDA